jgi:hypothetical protein
MTQVSLPNEKFLQREFVVPKIFEIMEPHLAFLDILPKIKTDSRAVRYKQEAYSASSDPKKKTPRRVSPGSRWTYLDITQMEIKSAILNKEGFAIRIDEDAVQFTEGVDEINRAYTKVAYWLAENLNTQTASTLTSGVTASLVAPAGVWDSTSSAMPVADLINFEDEMVQEGYPYRMTDVFLEQTNFKELKAYLTSMDIGDAKQKLIYGMPIVQNDTITIPVVSSTIHRLLSGLSHGALLALDANNPAGTIFYNNNPKYATEKIAYRVSDGSMKTVQNIGFNFNRYVDNETHDTIMQFWLDQVCVVKEPNAGRYLSTGI